MQLRCRCVRGRVAEKLHELQCVHRVNSGWNGEKLMVGDRRRGCHTLFFFSCFGDRNKGVRNARLERIELRLLCQYQNILSSSLMRSDNPAISPAKRGEAESNAIFRRVVARSISFHDAHLISFSLSEN